MQVFGEVFGFKAGRAKVWFELRDAAGALPCSMWREDFDKLELGPLADGAQVVVAGGCDYYPGSRTASPGFSLLASRGCAWPARATCSPSSSSCGGELRRRGPVRAAEGAAAPGAAALHRRRHRASRARRATTSSPACAGAAGPGRSCGAFAPVQDRHAAPAITRALQDLAACEEVEVIVVARGGGSLADLFAFCDETLCRTVALLRVPVISSVGHHTDRTLLDDVAAVACSTPTHAAETAVPVDCTAARARARRPGRAARAPGPPRGARARPHARPPHAARPAHHVARHRTRLHQHLRELRAATRRAIADGERTTLHPRHRPRAQVHRRGRRRRPRGPPRPRRRRARWTARPPPRSSAAAATSTASCATLAAHDPQRTLERGYALIEDPARRAVTSAEAARAQPRSRSACTTAASPPAPGGRAADDGSAPRRRSAEPRLSDETSF